MMHTFVTRVSERPSRQIAEAFDVDLPVSTLEFDPEPPGRATASPPFEFSSDSEDVLDQITLGFD